MRLFFFFIPISPRRSTWQDFLSVSFATVSSGWPQCITHNYCKRMNAELAEDLSGGGVGSGPSASCFGAHVECLEERGPRAAEVLGAEPMKAGPGAQSGGERGGEGGTKADPCLCGGWKRPSQDEGARACAPSVMWLLLEMSRSCRGHRLSSRGGSIQRCECGITSHDGNSPTPF